MIATRAKTQIPAEYLKHAIIKTMYQVPSAVATIDFVLGTMAIGDLALKSTS